MWIKALLMPPISQRLLSRARVLRLRARAEHRRIARGGRHQVHYFHQVDDPYSALTAAILPDLAARYDLDLLPHIVGAPPDTAAPERARLVVYSRKDAQCLAGHCGLEFRDPGTQPSPAAVQQATGLLIAAIGQQRFVALAGPVSARLWVHPLVSSMSAAPEWGLLAPHQDAVARHLAASGALRQKLGHYLGATFYYEGEWYWGLDRLHHLEQRLQGLGAQRPGVSGVMFPPAPDLEAPAALAQPAPIDFFFSLRSPYSAIVAPRVFALAQRTGAPVRLRYVLPMVMRGLPVPREKRRYISQDAAREAFVRGIPFGRLNDPVGRPTERGLALIPLADRLGLGQRYVLSFMQGVWSEGLDAGSDRGLRAIAGRAGLPWDAAQLALQDEAWRATAEANREALFSLGLWGVPSFRVGDTAVWGQDRLWAVQATLLRQLQGA